MRRQLRFALWLVLALALPVAASHIHSERAERSLEALLRPDGTCCVLPLINVQLAGQTPGDLMYADTITTFARLPAVATGQVLASQGVATAPAWSATPTLAGLTLTGPLLLPKGTAALPALADEAAPSTGISFGASSGINFSNVGAKHARLSSASFRLGSDVFLGWSPGTDPEAAASDTHIRRGAAAARISMGDGTTEHLRFNLGAATTDIFAQGATATMRVGAEAAGGIVQLFAGGSARWVVGTTGALSPTTANTGAALGTGTQTIGIMFIGAAGANMPATGTVRLQNASTFVYRNGANTLDVETLALTSGDAIRIGAGTNRPASVRIGTLTTPHEDATHRLGSSTLRWLENHVSDFTAIGTNPATAGPVRLANNSAIQARNAGNTANALLVHLSVNDHVELGNTAPADIRLGQGLTGDIRWGKPLVALGGGAAATLGTIGGAGPTAAAQNTWMRVQDSTGAAFWVPAWK